MASSATVIAQQATTVSAQDCTQSCAHSVSSCAAWPSRSGSWRPSGALISVITPFFWTRFRLLHAFHNTQVFVETSKGQGVQLIRLNLFMGRLSRVVLGTAAGGGAFIAIDESRRARSAAQLEAYIIVCRYHRVSSELCTTGGIQSIASCGYHFTRCVGLQMDIVEYS